MDRLDQGVGRGRHEAVKLEMDGAVLDLAHPMPWRPEASEEEKRQVLIERERIR
ncbi:hypothetical protein X773_34025 [Mesorhizobium sp. LSJC285A00]|nr:hypothetical protein X773_34025 [Mesorhizobium sp. LSJC285A00]